MANQHINPSPAVAVTLSDDGAALLVTGVINFKNVVKLREHGKQLLARQAHPLVIIDLQAVARSDNSGLVLLIAWMRDARELGKTIAFRHVPDFLKRMAEVFGLNSILLRE